MNKADILKEIIENRRSVFVKDYVPGAIDETVLAEIIGSAEFAPSHKKTKPWRLKLFKSEEKIRLGQKLAEIYQATTSPEGFLQKKFDNISENVAKSDAIITISMNFSGLVPEWEEIAATAMAVQNMYLTSTAHGIGSYWSTPGMIKHLNEFLELEENQKCYGLFYLGKI